MLRCSMCFLIYDLQDAVTSFKATNRPLLNTFIVYNILLYALRYKVQARNDRFHCRSFTPGTYCISHYKVGSEPLQKHLTTKYFAQQKAKLGNWQELPLDTRGMLKVGQLN